MHIREEIRLYAHEGDKEALLWLFGKYPYERQWAFVAKCSFARYGVFSHQAHRIWEPTKEGRILFRNAENSEE